MPRRLNASTSDFETQFAALIGEDREAEDDVSRIVKDIIADVRKRGDAALIELSARLDRVTLTPATLRVSPEEIAAAERKCPPDVKDALLLAAARIEVYHRRQLPKDESFTDAAGATLGWRWGPLSSVGLYVPGGTASYPSSVLMNAVPARVAGVERLVMVTPASGGAIPPLTLVAAKIAGVTEIYRIGGAQAVAALAYGTATIAPVDKIVGPGNAYVAAAKREVFGRVGIDSIAGPSEILVVADGDNDPAWIAADLLSQAEHDASSQSILITDDAAFADAVAAEVERQLAVLPRREIAARSWNGHGALIVVPSLADAAPLVDRIAPEHLEIATADPHGFFARVKHAGAAFLGRHTPEAVGDYIAGPNHVLPTSRTARFSSGLSVLDFLKRTSVLACDAEALSKLAPAALSLAEAEGLGAHGRSIAIRLNRK
ncbi:MAG TPA: histidinol dehydrogenase [Micropepsaceae bacterium]|jgi:histidinol dehydrogenase|nr:histidinol dehydrogenase [Micropepsaceae bacterium]